MLNFKSKLSNDNNIIHDTAIIDKSVKLGKNNFIGAFVVITGDVEIGDNNRFESHISIGANAQHRNSNKSYGVKIGSNNVFREFVTVHSGIHNVTKIGNDNYFMNYSHVPHDAILHFKCLLLRIIFSMENKENELSELFKNIQNGLKQYSISEFNDLVCRVLKTKSRIC